MEFQPVAAQAYGNPPRCEPKASCEQIKAEMYGLFAALLLASSFLGGGRAAAPNEKADVAIWNSRSWG